MIILKIQLTTFHFNYSFFHSVKFLLIFILFIGCDYTSLPKQKAYYAPQFDYPNYDLERFTNHSFQRNLISNLIQINDDNYELFYKKINAKLFFTKIEIDKNLEKIFLKFDEKIYNNSEYADEIKTSEYINLNKKYYSKLYYFIGDTPSNIQFYITDSINNFLSASLYFDSKPNYDSLLPYIHYIRNDIKIIVESFDWTN